MIRTTRAAIATVIAGWLAVVGGCGGKAPTVEFDEIGKISDREELTEVQIGRFEIPIPANTGPVVGDPVPRNLVQLSFHLVALVTPHEARELNSELDARRAGVRDRVIRTCRQASLADLDGDLTSLKTHLKDSLQPLLSDVKVKRLLMTHVQTQTL